MPLVVLIGLYNWRRHPRTTHELLALVILACLTSPLIYFIVYFCFLHRLRHFGHLFAPLSRRQRRRLIWVGFGYTLATVVLALLMARIAWPAAPPEETALRLVFIGLAAITVPHMIVVALARGNSASSIRTS